MEMNRIIVGCMRISDKDVQSVNKLINAAIENGINFFDHADIYGQGKSELIFAEAVKNNSGIKREDIILQSKCGIRPGICYDFSKDYIIKSVDGILQRLNTEYLDILLLHRPDALVEPYEVAEAFDELYRNGKVRKFGVSNHKPMQIELLKKYVNQPILYNQLQYSIPVSNLVANGLEVNMTSEGSLDRDGSVLDYCRLNDITIQAWSPFQMPNWQGCFINSEAYPELNNVLNELAGKYGVSATAIATAWILRHPANIQVVTGTTNADRLKEIISARDIKITREEWYRLYLAAGHILP
ncbi:MAG: aldo/keto reductase family oxidoreductase [Lachnospiraceae bacterium]|nr:aldo/keto reductase family oxidoreductase [Lachnospiraceae bacterium]